MSPSRIIARTLVTEHFSVEEAACHDGTPYPTTAIDEEDPDGRTWLETRLRPLYETLEVVRAECGAHPLFLSSVYRTLAYDQMLYDIDRASGGKATPQGSQHPKGRAADVKHPILAAATLHEIVLRLWRDGKLPHLGGLGLYRTFIHVDVRPRKPIGHLARWTGSRLTNR